MLEVPKRIAFVGVLRDFKGTRRNRYIDAKLRGRACDQIQGSPLLFTCIHDLLVKHPSGEWIQDPCAAVSVKGERKGEVLERISKTQPSRLRLWSGHYSTMSLKKLECTGKPCACLEYSTKVTRYTSVPRICSARFSKLHGDLEYVPGP